MKQQSNSSATTDTPSDTDAALGADESAALKARRDLGGRLASIRARSGLGGTEMSQVAFAALFSVHKNTYAAWERGERDVDARALLVLAERGWSPMWMLTGVEPETLKSSASPSNAVDTALITARSDADAYDRQGVAIKNWSAGVAAERGQHDARPEGGGTSQPVRRPNVSLTLDLLHKAIRISNEVLSKHGIRDAFDSDSFAEIVEIVYQDLARGYAEDRSTESLNRILAIAAQEKPKQK